MTTTATRHHRTLVHYHMEGLEWIGETVTGLYRGNHKTMWLLTVDGVDVELPRDKWMVCAE